MSVPHVAMVAHTVFLLSGASRSVPVSSQSMFSNLAASIKQIALPESVNVQKYFVRALTLVYIASIYVSLPFLPILMSIVFWRARYLVHYPQTLKKLRVHIRAMNEGPVNHYFQDVVGRVSSIPVQIKGSCTQCGNCCMDRRCVFLEAIGEGKYQCGIYHSMWRRFSNCGSYPLNAQDIKRYSCPGYVVAQEVPIQWMKRKDEVTS